MLLAFRGNGSEKLSVCANEFTDGTEYAYIVANKENQV